MTLLTDPDSLNDSAADDSTKEVYINPASGTIKLVTTGSLSTDGVTLKCLYSFLKEEWRNDPNNKNLAAYPFPMVPITDESFEFVDGWDFLNDTARYLIRTAGWTVKNVSGSTTQKWSGIIGLGSIESDDQLYYDQGSGSVNIQLTGQVNQAVQVLSDPNGDGNYTDGFDRRTSFKIFVREYAQTYDDANLTDIGVTSMDSIAYRFPIGTGTDLKVTNADTSVSGSTPYNEINVRYFTGSFKRDVDTTNNARSFGIVIDAGTHSGVDGVFTSGQNTLTSSAGGISGSNFVGGTLKIHSGSAKGTYNLNGGVPQAGNMINITTTFPASQTSASFTLYKSASLGATAEQIYEKVQFLLRQNRNINSIATGSVSVTGKTADLLLRFVGDTLEAGTLSPTNPAGGGSGVIIEGFSSSDTNRLTFRDNGATNRTYPYVAVLTINFGTNLSSDASAKYWVYFTTLPGAGNDFGESGALIVDDNDGADMSGSISSQTSIQRTFNYDGNVQGGRTAGTDATITAIGIGLSTGQYVRAQGTIARSTANSISLVAALERNYSNP